jgi:hypothetical protein
MYALTVADEIASANPVNPCARKEERCDGLHCSASAGHQLAFDIS